jgi:hypothetical protein
MPYTSEQRQGPDRRRQPRGGRRPSDPDGFAPLVMVVGDDAVRLAEAVLAKLRFAVTTSRTADDAARVVPDLKPDIIVAESTDAARIRQSGNHLAIVEMSDDMRADPLVLIESIRAQLRRAMS